MPEIEKKFLLGDEQATYLPEALGYPTFEELATDVIKNGEHIRQGYMNVKKGIVLAGTLGLKPEFSPVEARLRDKAGNFFFTLKGDGTIERDELEIKISEEVFETYWPDTQGRRVEKKRLKKPYNGYLLEIDYYLDRKLVVVEVELKSQAEAEKLPVLGKDITSDKGFKNKNLAK